MRPVLICSLCLFNLLLPRAAWGQAAYDPEAGLHSSARKFALEEYGAFMQNWSIVQDGRGLVYVANNNGILEYDGASWRLIPTRTGTIVRSVARDDIGTIYVGMQGDFGYLKPDATGILRYVSLANQLEGEATDFKDVWSVHATKEGVYFQAREWLFRWDGRRLRTWKAEGVFHTSFVIDGTFYVREHGRGLVQMEADSLQLAPGGEFFRDLPIYAMMPLSKRRVLIGTRKEGFLIYDQGGLTPLATEVDGLLKEHKLYNGTVLPDGSFALATLGAGVLVIDASGRLLRRYNEAAGLSDLWVNAVYVDNQNGLWMALDTGGIMRVDAVPQLSVLDDRLGIQGAVIQILRHKGVLYVGTSAGLFALREHPDASAFNPEPPRFERIGNLEMVRSLLTVEDELVVGTGTGVHSLQGKSSELLADYNTFDLIHSRVYPERIYVATKEDGLKILQRTPTTWEALTFDSGVDAEIRHIVEDRDGSLWLGTVEGDLVHVSVPSRSAGGSDNQHFSSKNGLPDELIVPFVTARGIRFASREGIFEWIANGSGVERRRLFKPDPVLTPDAGARQDTLYANAVDSEGNVWLGYADRIEKVVRNADGSFRRVIPQVLNFRKKSLFEIYVEPDGIVWLNDGNSLLRYDSRAQASYNAPYAALVRSVRPIDSDSLIFGGNFQQETGHVGLTQVASFLPVLEYETSDLEFEFAAPSLNSSDRTEYRFYLEGRDLAWGSWTLKSHATYTNLPEGTYHFHVQARSALGHLSSVGTFTFRILPPWYRTWWAYAIYVGMAVGAGMLAMHYRRAMIENRKAREQAAQLARERLANERLQQANARLKEADRIKDEFLTNTSHELRTPITAILGFTSVLKEETPDQYHEFLGIIEENGKRLLQTVSSLLDMARLKAGAVDLNREVLNVSDEVASVLSLLTPLAERKKLWLELVRPAQPVHALLDTQCFERVLDNLITNAVKFTDEGGVTVRVDAEGGKARVQVIDTGIGIDEEFLPYLFQEFRQGSTGLARSHEGSGLGLAITASLVQLMGGAIHVESCKGAGSTFTITFPQVVEKEFLVDHVTLQ